MSTTETDEIDIRIEGNFGLYMLEPLTARGRKWVDANVSYGAWQVMGGAIGIDGRKYAAEIAFAARDEGLNIESEV